MNKDTKLPKYMTRNGPGDKDFELSLLGGKVDTSAWFQDQLTNVPSETTGPWNYNPNVLEKGSIAQKAKDQEIFFFQ